MDTEQGEERVELAPKDGGLPVFEDLRQEFQKAVASMDTFMAQQRDNFETRHALWDGQTSDGKKHRREGEKTLPTPWEGASDIQVRLVDDAVNSYVALTMASWRKANIVAVPIQGADAPRARLVSQFFKYLVNSQMPNLDAEIELLANAYFQDGIGVTGQFWEERTDLVLKRLKVDDMAPELQAALADPNNTDLFVQMAMQSYQITEKKAKRLIRDLKANGETTIPAKGRRISRPVLRTFTLGENLFIHSGCTDIENAPAIFRLEYYTPAQLRSFVESDGFDAEWVEDAIEKVRGQQIELTVNDQRLVTSTTLNGNVNRYEDRIGVVYAYQRLSDEDGVPGVYCTIFHPNMPACEDGSHEGFAKHGLLEDDTGQYPFVLHRREHLDRRIYSTRGLPEMGKPYQQQIKACTDARIDAASLSVLPPLLFPQGREPLQWGPGARVPERRPGEYHYADRPTYDITNTTVEKDQYATWREYAGFTAPEGDQAAVAAKKSTAVEKFLYSVSLAMRQVYYLWRQYGDTETWFRVVGGGNQDPQKITKPGPDEDHDIYLTYSSLTTHDSESFERIVQSVAQTIQTFDKYGQVNYSEWLTMVLSAIDPSIADRIIDPKEKASQRTVTEVKDLVARTAAGFDESVDLTTPPEIGMQVLQQYSQAPDVQQRMAQDQAFGERIQKLFKQYSFQAQQQQNAVIGRYGA